MKGMMTQGMVVLLKQPINPQELLPALQSFEGVRPVPAGKHIKHMGGPGFLVPYHLESNGIVLVDIQNHPWPDLMEDKNDIFLFGAWSSGYYTPFAWPRNLERAVMHAWDWEEASQVVPPHRAMVRINLSYSFGKGDDDPLWPEKMYPKKELAFLSKLAGAILKLPQACVSSFPQQSVCVRWTPCNGHLPKQESKREYPLMSGRTLAFGTSGKIKAGWCWIPLAISSSIYPIWNVTFQLMGTNWGKLPASWQA